MLVKYVVPPPQVVTVVSAHDGNRLVLELVGGALELETGGDENGTVYELLDGLMGIEVGRDGIADGDLILRKHQCPK
jgi:hypothetical protein